MTLQEVRLRSDLGLNENEYEAELTRIAEHQKRWSVRNGARTCQHASMFHAKQTATRDMEVYRPLALCGLS